MLFLIEFGFDNIILKLKVKMCIYFKSNYIELLINYLNFSNINLQV